MTWDIFADASPRDFVCLICCVISQTENYCYHSTGLAILQISLTSRGEIKCSVSNMFVYKRHVSLIFLSLS